MLAACTNNIDPDEVVEPIGDFRMGYNIVVANDVTKGPLSRPATEDELTTAVKQEIETRMGRYNGDGLYHLGVRVEAYVLAQPGIPVIAAPKSIMILGLQVWDDATQEKLTPEPVRITAFEAFDTGVPLIPSGLVKGREKQLENLSKSAARLIEEHLRENEELWFGPKEGRERVEFDRNAPREGEALAIDPAGPAPTPAN
jgi:hypothetical protein